VSGRGTIIPDVDLDVLARLIGAPPRQTPPVDWAAVEETLGLRLPADFKSFASAYGPIELGEFVSVWSPDGAAAWFNHDRHQWLRASRDLDPLSYPYTFWPEPGGLLMWGRSRLSHHFFWDTSASTDPQRWPTVVYSYLSPAPEVPGAGLPLTLLQLPHSDLMPQGKDLNILVLMAGIRGARRQAVPAPAAAEVSGRLTVCLPCRRGGG
jgi:hypothetical protein